MIRWVVSSQDRRFDVIGLGDFGYRVQVGVACPSPSRPVRRVCMVQGRYHDWRRIVHRHIGDGGVVVRVAFVIQSSVCWRRGSWYVDIAVRSMVIPRVRILRWHILGWVYALVVPSSTDISRRGVRLTDQRCAVFNILPRSVLERKARDETWRCGWDRPFHVFLLATATEQAAGKEQGCDSEKTKRNTHSEPDPLRLRQAIVGCRWSIGHGCR